MEVGFGKNWFQQKVTVNRIRSNIEVWVCHDDEFPRFEWKDGDDGILIAEGNT
jgi:hypothetical protein